MGEDRETPPVLGVCAHCGSDIFRTRVNVGVDLEGEEVYAIGQIVCSDDYCRETKPVLVQDQANSLARNHHAPPRDMREPEPVPISDAVAKHELGGREPQRRSLVPWVYAGGLVLFFAAFYVISLIVNAPESPSSAQQFGQAEGERFVMSNSLPGSGMSDDQYGLLLDYCRSLASEIYGVSLDDENKTYRYDFELGCTQGYR